MQLLDVSDEASTGNITVCKMDSDRFQQMRGVVGLLSGENSEASDLSAAARNITF